MSSISRQISDTEDIADSAVTTSKIADSNVTTAKIANSNVTTAKIADQNVTTAKLATGERMTQANVRTVTATSGAGLVGTYAFLRISVPGSTTRAPGYTASSGLVYSAITSGTSTILGSTVATGTWRLMGEMVNPSGSAALMASLWLRVS